MPQRSGIDYFIKGFGLIQTKGLKRFVFIPLAINLVFFSIAFYWLFLQLDEIFAAVIDYLPSWLEWITAILWPLAIIAILVVFSYVFSAVTNWLAAPFNGLLAEKVEAHLTGHQFEDAGFGAVIKDVPRTFTREWQKLAYYLPRALGFLLLFILLPLFIPLFFFLPPIGTVIWFLFSAWMMSIQYCDYAFDNHKIGFNEMKDELKQQKGLCYSFGMITMVFSMIPVLNLVVMPVAICGATLMWVERFKD